MSSMEKLFDVYLSNSLQLSAIILLMMALSPLMARRYSAKCRYYLWIIIFAALIIPVREKITLTLPKVFQSILPQSINTTTSGTVAITGTINIWDWHQYAGLLWAIGVFCFLGWHLLQHLRFLAAVRRWSDDIKDSAILKQFILTKSELGIRNHIAIKSCACIKTPMGIGLFHPVVLLPQIDFSQDELPLILKHELVHYKRRDLWYKVLIMIVSALHWFNPIVYFMVRSVLNLCEISCDEEVLRGFDAKGRVQYGEAIIGIVRSGSGYKTVLSTNFYSGIQGMKKRIYTMMDMSRKQFSFALFIAVLMIAICGTTSFTLSPIQTERILQNSSKIAIAAAGQGQTSPGASSVQPSSTSDTEQNNQEKQISHNNGLLSDKLICVKEGIPVEQFKEQIYYSRMPRLVAGGVQP